MYAKFHLTSGLKKAVDKRTDVAAAYKHGDQTDFYIAPPLC